MIADLLRKNIPSDQAEHVGQDPFVILIVRIPALGL